MNGVFVEYVDRYFYLRGWAAMGGVPIACVFLGFSLFFGFDLYGFSNVRAESQVVAAWVAVSVLGGFSMAVFYFALLRDFFCYTHYPIRFNRINRKVYVFRHNGEGGVLDLDWDKVYWFVGRSRDGSDISFDLRCHVLDADGIVRDTFAVGHFASTRAEILQHWEMIRRYMEESPAALPFPPLALVISTEPTWRNCITIQVGGASGHSPLFMLLTVPWAFFRWISQITCRRPRWPDEVEAECQIPIDDPYRLAEPASSGEVVGLDEVAEAALFEYRQKAEAAALAYEAAYSKQAAN
ncbi:DUF6708 domain-containing protein [Pseudomonas weihenstephanensis]|uniref:DUF6708 domain-containing protein n=1 Tax=Pseudomonas weihenstephanensis TaxID=1608994 RepID=UPI0012FCFBB9|nr:DUF6708 domain-containing protein [Pseudomonas weihenstephanensis]